MYIEVPIYKIFNKRLVLEGTVSERTKAKRGLKKILLTQAHIENIKMYLQCLVSI